MTQVHVGRADKSHLEGLVGLQLELAEHHHRLDPENPRYLITEEEWRTQIETALEDGGTRFLVASEADELYGFVRLTIVNKPWGLSCEMDTLVVTGSKRNVGIGRLLAEAAEREAGSLGARAMRANVVSTNVRGREFYGASGYTEIAVRYGKALE